MSWQLHKRLYGVWGLCVSICLFFFPVVVSAALPSVILVENHGDVLVHWARTGVRGAVVVNVDAHDDCNPISPKRANKLRSMLASNNFAAIEQANTISDSGLYSISTYIAAAAALGIASEAVWVAPTIQKPGVLNKIPDFTIRISPMESLPEIRKPVLLTVDADIVPSFAKYRCINELDAILLIAKTLRAAPWNVVHASVCFSVDGGFLPITLRWVGNALYDALNGKDLSLPDAPWTLLCKVEDWRRSLLPAEVVRRLRPLVQQKPKDPWLRVYLADALFRTNDVSGSLTEGLKAASLDPGCSRILPEIGNQLADAGRIDEAESFLAAAPAIVNIAAELNLAQALDKTGQTAKALKHLVRIRKESVNYNVELLIGYAYERLNEPSQARLHYMLAVTILEDTHETMPVFPDIEPALLSAEQFLRSTGNKKQAQILRRDIRLARFFKTE